MQLRCSLPTYCGGHLRAESCALSPEGSHRIGDREASRDNYLHHEMPAIRGREDLLDEKIVYAISNVAIGERKIQRTLHLSTELLCFSFGLTVRRRAARLVFVQSF